MLTVKKDWPNLNKK